VPTDKQVHWFESFTLTDLLQDRKNTQSFILDVLGGLTFDKVSHSISEHIRDILHGKEVDMKYTIDDASIEQAWRLIELRL